MLVSGSGTLLESMVRAHLPIVLVIADRPCRGLEIADDAGIANELVARDSFGKGFERDDYSQQIKSVLLDNDIELVAMAGFGTVLTEVVFEAFPGRILNTHPALLPSFPGWHAVRDALAHGVKVTGCTIHVATPEVDAGPILAQAPVSIEEDEDEASLHERIKTVERSLYIETLRNIEARGHVLGVPVRSS